VSYVCTQWPIKSRVFAPVFDGLACSYKNEGSIPFTRSNSFLSIFADSPVTVLRLFCTAVPIGRFFWGFLPRDRIQGITVANVLCLPVGSLKPPDTFIQTSYSRSPHSCLAPVGPWPCDTWRVLSMACLVGPAVTSSFSKRRLWPRRLPVRRSRHWKGRRTPGVGACLLRARPGFGDRGGQTGRRGGSASPPPHA
jgi:hypothetical protein